MKRIINGVTRRLRKWADRLASHMPSGRTRGLVQRRQACRFRPLPEVDLLVVLDRATTDPVSQSVRQGENANELCMELMRGIVRRGDRLLDLGGHVGLFSLTAAALGCEVLTVEASYENAALIRASARLNGFTNLHLVHVAIGASAGLVSFCEDGPFGSIAGSRVPRQATSRVALMSADGLLAGMGWEQVAFVKMDVEGSEVAALAGMRKLLGSANAPVLLLESNDHTLNFFDQTPETLKQTLAAAGYRCYQVGARRLTECPPDQTQGLTVVDYLAVKGSLMDLPVGWTTSSGFTEDELVGQLHASLTDASADERASAARRLARAPSALRNSPLLGAALSALDHDPSEQVRQAAAWRAKRAA